MTGLHVIIGVLVVLLVICVWKLLVKGSHINSLVHQLNEARDAPWRETSKRMDQMHDDHIKWMKDAREREATRHANRMEELREQRPNAAMEVGLFHLVHWDAQERMLTVGVARTAKADETLADLVKHQGGNDRMMWVSQP